MIGRRSRSGGLSGLTLVICLGLIIGILYIFYNNRPADSAPEAAEPKTAVFFRTPGAFAQPTQPRALPTRTPVPGEMTNGARFFAPTAGIDTPIIQSYLNGESWDIQDLGRYAGHLQGTAWMSQTGNIVLAGHVEMVDGRKGVFSAVSELSIGDPLILVQGQERRVYNVSDILHVEPDDLTPLYPTSNDRLTLVTCTGYDFVEDIYQQRLVVVAERVS